MTPEERDAILAYVEEIERFARLYALQFDSLKFLLLKKGVISGDEIDEAVKTVEAAIAVEETLDPRFEALERLKKYVEEQK